VAGPVWVSFDQFSGRVGQTFQIGTDGGPSISAELVEATEGAEAGGTGPDGQARQQFALVFRGPAEPVLPQATYAVEHDELGRLEIFLVPIGPTGSGMRYEAVFA
jgi:Domain of unknown function (DUF6916)